jgi:ABC-type transporter Mla MlaB component
MEYSIRLSADEQYIILTISGEINRQNALPLNREAHALGKEKGIRCYLVDLTHARNTDTPVQSYNFAYTDMQSATGIDRNARVALLVSPGDTSHHFMETVARNAGLNVRLFTNREEAIRHLLPPLPPAQTEAAGNEP